MEAPAPAGRPVLQTATASPVAPRPVEATGPALRDFLGGEETRLRDLLAFGMAAESGRPPGPDAIQALRRKAESDLEAHAFRVLHNQVEAIRRQAMDEQMGRVRRGLSFPGAVAANLLALAIGGAIVLFVMAGGMSALGPLADGIAQVLAQFSAR